MSTSSSSGFCASCGTQRMFVKEAPNHILHLLLTLVTCTAWLYFVWLPLTLISAFGRSHCTSCGASAGGRTSSSDLGFLVLIILIACGGLVAISPKVRSGIASHIKSPSAAKSEPAPRFATELDGQREAMRLYPDLGQAGSAMNREFVARVKRYRSEKPEFFRDTGWPVTLAEEIAGERK